MKVKFLHDHGYPSLKHVVGKVVNVVHSDEITCMINGSDLIAAGADDHYINPAWSYTFSLGDFVGDKGRGLQVVEG
ncbi:TPA: hypothetical protein HMM56_05455 [Escherichia coli]|uniref:hypothetical protein n=1 Tax=Escherichia coli TaxID=562 RepID=UPI0017CDEF78|nr:hypothetical protein [Escherichia coli]HAJ2221714.1 hypothetical protein [Escherichia coli]HDJ9372829.1 hypothetical protein [Escherichia coli]HDK1325626.1 hypothetical protein [Escherichia coli]